MQLFGAHGPRLVLSGALAVVICFPACGDTRVFHASQPAAEQCSERLIGSPDASPALVRICEDALSDADLTQKNRAATLLNTGIAHMRQGDTDEALRLFAEAKEVGGDLPGFEVNIAAAQLHEGDARSALRTLSNIEVIDPAYRHIALYNRAMAHWSLDEIEGAYQDFKAAEDLRPDFKPAQEALTHFAVEPQ